MNRWLQGVIGVCLVTMTGVFAYDKLASPSTPIAPDTNPDLNAVLFAKMNPLLDGDAALYYAGVFDAAAHATADLAELDTRKELAAFVKRLGEAANTSEPSPVDLSAVILEVFGESDVPGELTDKERADAVAKLQTLAKVAEACK